MTRVLYILLLIATASLLACADDDAVTSNGGPSASGCEAGSPARAGDVARVEPGSGDLSDVTKIDCQPGSPSDAIRQGALVETETYGMVRFGLISKTFYCQVLRNSSLNVLPPGGDVVVWKGTSGSSWCGKSPAARDQLYRAPNNVLIAAADPIFGVEIHDEMVIVKVAEGSVTVAAGDGEPIAVREGERLVILSSGEVQREPLETTDEDEEAIAWLRTVISPDAATPSDSPSLPPAPDLVIEDVDPEYVLIEESCRVHYVVTNLGTMLAQDSLSRVTVNGEEADEKIPALTPGESAEFATLVEPAVCEDNFEVTVVADAESAVEESDESNNATRVAVQ